MILSGRRSVCAVACLFVGARLTMVKLSQLACDVERGETWRGFLNLWLSWNNAVDVLHAPIQP